VAKWGKANSEKLHISFLKKERAELFS